MPRALGFRQWFETRFSDLCEKHDLDYCGTKPRRQSDCELAGAILARGYFVFAVLTFFFVRLFGVSHYNRRQALT